MLAMHFFIANKEKILKMRLINDNHCLDTLIIFEALLFLTICNKIIIQFEGLIHSFFE